MDELEDTTKIELLKYFHTIRQNEIDFLRERQEKIFTWSSNILLLVIGALLVIDQSKSIIWSSQGAWGRLLASVAVFVIMVFSIWWQQRNRIWQRESEIIRNKIENVLHCFEEGYYEPDAESSLFPAKWNRLKNPRTGITLRKRLFRVNYVSATLSLGLLAIAMIWLSGL